MAEGLLVNESIGFLVDFLIINTLAVVIILLQYSVGKYFRRSFYGLMIFIVVLLCLFHLLLLKYYVYALKPVDQFLFTYSLKELLFTITTSETNFLAVVILIILFVAAAWFIPRLFNKIRIGSAVFLWICMVLIISVPLGIYSNRKIASDSNDIRRNIRMNKSVYIYKKSFTYLVDRQEDTEISPAQIQKFQSVFSGKEYSAEEYPFLHNQNYQDVLGNFFNTTDTLPNFVILIVEGLGERFMHSFHGVQLMPFLDSLSGRGLYWDRFLTTGERSFAVVPSITGSLPYGEKGFTVMDRLPRHITMLSLLKRYGYESHFFYGQGAWFHQKDRFFKANDMDLIVDKSGFSEKYEKVMALKNSFFWGYHDEDLFQQSLEILDTLSSDPRIDIYFTGSMHSPFPTSSDEYYSRQLDSLAGISDLSPMDRRYIDKYGKYLRSVLFFDRALRNFMEGYSGRNDFHRTIFIITGDHPMTEIPIENSIRRYHVPLVIYSPMISKPRKFHSTGSHLDIYPTILAFLKVNFHLSLPASSVDLGYSLDTMTDFRNVHPVPFMNDNREIIDYLENGYFLSQGNRVFRVDTDLNLIDDGDPGRLSVMQENLHAFRQVNRYTCMNDKIIPDYLYFKALHYNQLYSVSKEIIEISETDEYVGIYPVLTLSKNEELYLDFSCTLEYNPREPLPAGVIQVINGRDSTLHWQSFALADIKTGAGDYPVKIHVKVDTRHIQESPFYIKCYFWNNRKGYLRIRDLQADLYQQKE